MTRVKSCGYIRVHAPSHPNASVNGYVYEHRLVVEAVLGRLLEYNEVVHHKNGNRSDNRACNLEVIDRGDHVRKHRGKLERNADLVVRLYETEGLSVREIGRCLDVQHTNVAVFLRRCGVKIQRNKCGRPRNPDTRCGL